MENEFVDLRVIKNIYIFVVGRDFSWLFTRKTIKNDYGIEIGVKEMIDMFTNYFKNKFGIKIYGKCLACGEGIIEPRISPYGYWCACSRYPQCSFKEDCKDVTNA